MPSYIPEHVYGFTGWDERNQPTYGLVPWPKHLQPREPADIELTKKGEAYAAAHEALPDINLRELFGEPEKRPAFVEADGAFFITLSNDRATVAYTIERLIDMLDAMEDDPDLEPSLGYNPYGCDDREGCGGTTGGDEDDEPSLGWAATRQLGENPKLSNVWGELEADDADDERTLGWELGSSPYDQSCLTQGMYGPDEVEEENEHGGDINDVPHDAADCGDDEPFLGWTEKCSQGADAWRGRKRWVRGVDPDGAAATTLRMPLDFRGDGYRDANEALRKKGKRGVRVSPALGDVPVFKASDFDRLPWA